jgi:hypothetical protein
VERSESQDLSFPRSALLVRSCLVGL